jgi:PleD family two-component response regulator
MGDRLEEMLAAADQALYASKRAGKQVVLSTKPRSKPAADPALRRR